MKGLWTNRDTRRLVLARLLEGSGLLLIIVACVWGYGQAWQTHEAVSAAQVRLADHPQYLLRLSSVQQELRGRSPDIERILRLVGDSQAIVGFIEELEETAQGRRVVLEVPSINEVQEVDETGQLVELRGPFRSISLTIAAHGRAEDLLQYIHDVEHAPHLVSLRDWNITAALAAVPVAAAAPDTRQAGSTAQSTVPVRVGQLDAELILVVHNEKYSP